MNSDWETVRRCALRHSSAGYAERWQHLTKLAAPCSVKVIIR